MIRPQQNDEPTSKWRSLDVQNIEPGRGDTAPVAAIVGVVGGSMSGKGSGVNTGDLPGQDAERRSAEPTEGRQTARNELPRRGERSESTQSRHRSVEVG